MDAHQYDEDYFEHGTESGKSLYDHYRWLPELTLPMAHHIAALLDLRPSDKVLDFGCAKGFLVQALRMLGINAYGCDISQYALDCASPSTAPYLLHIHSLDDLPCHYPYIDWLISKDVLEHLAEREIDDFLKISRRISSHAFHVIPLGNGTEFIVPEYEEDSTHITSESESWWINRFESNGWRIKAFSYAAPGIKGNWTSKHPHGNGFFILE